MGMGPAGTSSPVASTSQAGLALRLRPPRIAILAASVAACAVVGAVVLGSVAGGTDHTRAGAASTQQAAKSPALSFVENRGQTDRRARYYMQGKDASVFFTSQGLAFSLAGQKSTDRHWGLSLDFLGARAHPQPLGQARTQTSVSYFKGERKDWKTGLATYSQVAYRNVWPGVDLVYSGTEGRLKYNFLVQPGADPRAIRLGWRGATGLATNASGQLVVSTPARKLRDDAPVSYQQVGGRRVPVATSYALGGASSYGFQVGSYDRSRPLVIDPAVLVYSGYIGGTGDEQANKVTVDRSGNAYVVGATTSADFPTTVGPVLASNEAGGLDDAFIAKVKADGSGVAYAGFLGGSSRDQAINVAVDAAGAAYLGGTTASSNFPVTPGSFDTSFNGGPQDAWVAKVRPDGKGLAYAGFIGGGTGNPSDTASNNEQANGVAVDAAGNAYVSGFTVSSETTGFPTGTGFGGLKGYDKTFNSLQPPPGGPLIPDGFLVKVNPAGSALTYATYIGGGSGDASTGVAATAKGGQAYVNMFTGSSEDPNDPFGRYNGIKAPAFKPTYTKGPSAPAPDEAGVTKLDTNVDGAASLLAGTYIGGAGSEQPFDNVLDSAGNVYLTGKTNSDQRSFPNGRGFASLRRVKGFDKVLNTGPGANCRDETTPAVCEDAFIIKLNSSLTSASYASYIGGSGSDNAIGIDVPSAGGPATIFGTTSSSNGTFPARSGPDRSYNGGPSDAFIARVNTATNSLDYAGFVGGAGLDEGFGVALDASGNAYVAGRTDSDQRTGGFPVKVGPATTKRGGFGSVDAFAAKIDPPAPVVRSLSASPKVLSVSTTFRYRLSDNATVRFFIQRRTTGRRVFNSCRKATRRNRGRRACVLYVNFGNFARKGVKGRNRQKFSGRLGRRVLRPGSYRALVVATDASGKRSRTRSAKFTFARR